MRPEMLATLKYSSWFIEKLLIQIIRVKDLKLDQVHAYAHSFGSISLYYANQKLKNLYGKGFARAIRKYE